MAEATGATGAASAAALGASEACGTHAAAEETSNKGIQREFRTREDIGEPFMKRPDEIDSSATKIIRSKRGFIPALFATDFTMRAIVII